MDIIYRKMPLHQGNNGEHVTWSSEKYCVENYYICDKQEICMLPVVYEGRP